MESKLANIIITTVQQTTPRTPWQTDWVIESIMLGFIIIGLVFLWLWLRSGRTQRENKIPFERTAEDFAGTVQAGYGVLPVFLYFLYAAIGLWIVGYIVTALITGVQY